jgi:hypothetical protein
MKCKVMLLLGALALSPAGIAQQPKPGTVNTAATGDVITVTANIKAVDLARRTVTLQGALGHQLVMRVDDTVANLDQIAPGDKFVVKYSEAVLLKLEKSAAAPDPRGATMGQVTARGAGAKRAKAEPKTMNARVSKIDADQNRLLLDGGRKGDHAEVKVKNPEVIKGLNIGDRVVATYIPAVVISIQAPQ